MREQSVPLATQVAAIASAQHGVVARSHLLMTGMSSATIARWIRVGHLHRIHRGVYAVGHRMINQEGQWMAATLACGEGSALSHEPAGQLLYFLDRWSTLCTSPSLIAGAPIRPASSFTARARSSRGTSSSASTFP